MTADDVDTYRTHGRWSDPGRFAPHVRAIAPEPRAVATAISGLVLHPLFARMRGIALAPAALDEPNTRPVRSILERLLARNDAALTVARPIEQRFVGVCRHFALLATSVLRTHGVAARARVGFATYFAPGRLEDHWVCEYWDEDRWRLLDAQLDAAAVAALGVAFDPCDVPRDAFVVAPTVWRRVRAGEIDPETVGLSPHGLTGEWFAAGNVLRDAAALVKEELLPWDVWGSGRDFIPGRALTRESLDRVDAVALLLEGVPGAARAERVYREHAWLAVTPTVLSFSYPNGTPTEVTL